MGAETHIYKIVFCVQKPVHVSFAELEELDHYVDLSLPSGATLDDLLRQECRRKFKTDYVTHVPWSRLITLDASAFVLVQDLKYMGGGTLETSSMDANLETVLAALPVQARASTSSTTTRNDTPLSVEDKLIEKNPWLRGSFDADKKRARSSKEDRDDVIRDDDEDAHDNDITAEELFAAMADLDDARATYNDTLSNPDFPVKTLGGDWTMAHLGRPFDAFRSEPRGEAAVEWAVLYGFGKYGARFNLGLFGIANAHMLCLTWASKCQHFYAIYKGQANDRYQYTDDDLATWVDPVAFVDARNDAAGPARRRYDWLAAKFPRRLG